VTLIISTTTITIHSVDQSYSVLFIPRKNV